VLKLKADPTFVTAVKIPAPTGDIQIKVEFKHMTRDAYRAFIEQEADKKRSDEDAIMDIACGWQEVDAQFSREAVAELCQQYHAAPRAIVETFIRELTQFKLGNSAG
jgi:hypothetical protein